MDIKYSYYQNQIRFWLRNYAYKTLTLFIGLTAILFFVFKDAGNAYYRIQFAVLSSLIFSLFISVSIFIYSNIYKDFQIFKQIKKKYYSFLKINDALQVDLNKFHVNINTFSASFYMIRSSNIFRKHFSACLEFHADTNGLNVEVFYHYCAFYKLKPKFHFWPGIILVKFPDSFDSHQMGLETEKIVKTFYQSGIRSISPDQWNEHYLDYFLDNYYPSRNLFSKKTSSLLIDEREIEMAN